MANSHEIFIAFTVKHAYSHNKKEISLNLFIGVQSINRTNYTNSKIIQLNINATLTEFCNANYTLYYFALITIKFKQSWSSTSTLICRKWTLLFDLNLIQQ